MSQEQKNNQDHEPELPQGVPKGAKRITIHELARLAELDPSLKPVYLEAVKAIKDSKEKKAADDASAAGDQNANPHGLTKETLSNGRMRIMMGQQEVYEWKQSLEEVNIWVKLPPGVPTKQIGWKLTPTHIKLGLRLDTDSPQYYFDEALGGTALPEESSMIIEDGVVEISIQKAEAGAAWPAALAAHAALNDAADEENIRKQILLERFQRENPNFDFSRAKFSGTAPDAREFMGGINMDRFKK